MIRSRIVILTEAECASAMVMGTQRFFIGESRGYLQTDGTKSITGHPNHQRGAAAEIATAKYYGLKWDATIDTYRGVPDLAGCEVRSTRPNRLCLRIKMTDNPGKREWPFILVTRLGDRQFRIEGWITGSIGMQNRYYVPCDQDSKKPEWNVPVADLSSPESLTFGHRASVVIAPA